MRHVTLRAITTLIGVATALTLAAACSGTGTATHSPTSAVSSTATPAVPATTGATPVTPPGSGVGAQPTAPATTPAGAVDPNGPEVVDPGDIPDNQVFVAFDSVAGSYSVNVPEGWARTDHNGVVTFTDKYNSIALQSTTAATAPTVSLVKANGLTDVVSDPTFKLLDVTTVTRRAGDGVLATYEIGSAPNAVTGKQALLAVERYAFFHNGTEVTLTLSGAKGADNVDPWKIVSDSLTWK